MEEALNTDIHVINFVTSNSVNDRFFVQFSEDGNLKTQLLHTQVRWRSKGLRVERLVNLWEPLIIFLMLKSQMTNFISKNQADKTREILERVPEFK